MFLFIFSKPMFPMEPILDIHRFSVAFQYGMAFGMLQSRWIFLLNDVKLFK